MSDVEEVNGEPSGSKKFCGFDSIDEFSKVRNKNLNFPCVNVFDFL